MLSRAPVEALLRGCLASAGAPLLVAGAQQLAARAARQCAAGLGFGPAAFAAGGLRACSGRGDAGGEPPSEQAGLDPAGGAGEAAGDAAQANGERAQANSSGAADAAAAQGRVRREHQRLLRTLAAQQRRWGRGADGDGDGGAAGQSGGARRSLRTFAPLAAPASSSPPSAAPAEPQQQQEQQQPASASEAAESFVTVTPSTAAAAAAAAGAGTRPPAAAAAASAGGVLAGAAAAPDAEYTMRQVSKHSTDETCWIVVNGKVYDVTSYLDDHPGGSESILLNAGVDCTEEFMGVHSQEAKDLLEKFVIGRVKAGKPRPAATPATTPAATSTATAPVVARPASGPPVALQDPRERYMLPLAEKRQLSHDTLFMRFALPSPQHRVGLPCGKHVFLCADISGEPVVRAYTPISSDRDLGVLDFLIKVYWAGVSPRFPAGGKMTQHLASMKEGDCIAVKGPYGKFSYGGEGQYTLNRVDGRARYMSMVAGGSGVTPCYSVLREVLRDPRDATRCSLVYANKHEEDIWLREELDAMARDHPDQLHLWYVVEEPGAPPTPPPRSAAALLGAEQTAPEVASGGSGGGGGGSSAAGETAGAAPWAFSRGFITADMMAQHLLPCQPVSLPQQQQQEEGGSLALMCGPPGLLEGVVVPGLAAMGYRPEQMVLF